MNADISVIIPTHNRKEMLLKTLEAYTRQTAVRDIQEVIVVDDGSADGTGEAVAQAKLGSPFPIRYLRQDNRGPSVARNRGIRSAEGELVLLGDDDIIPTPTLVAEHVAWHRNHPSPTVAVLGLVAWSPELNPTPFMEWMALDGGLFAFGHLSPGCEAEYVYFYSCNLSLKKCFLLEHGMFDEEFRTAAYEDLELGYRLKQKGLRLLYNPNAVGHHYRRVSFAQVCRREATIKAALELFNSKVPPEGRGAGAAGPNESARRRALRRVAGWLAPAWAPLTFLLDTHIPLPRRAYREIFFRTIPWIIARQQARWRSYKTDGGRSYSP